jgi:glycosyltransferase involved in cell wall biosynthesis
MLDRITPVLLTYNEEQNIARTLSRLRWARDIVIVDSGSTDGTLTAIASFPSTRVFHRQFDTHAKQWSFAVDQTKITSDWILRLDADYFLTDALIDELGRLDPDAGISAYRIAFDYAIFSRRLMSSLYPANTILLRRNSFSVKDEGHTEVWEVRGPIAALSNRIIHDDWKPTGQWVVGQVRYMQRELDWMQTVQTRRSRLVHWLRLRPPFMPIAVFLYCLFARGLLLNGRAGIFYALQRMVAEAVLSLMVLEHRMRSQTSHSPPGLGDQ